MAKARREFPNIMSRQMLPPEAPSQIPNLTLGGTSSQLALSSAQADFEVRFYGEYMRDLDRGLECVEKKIQAVLSAYQAIDVVPSLIGLVARCVSASRMGRRTLPSTCSELISGRASIRRLSRTLS